jgi:hypothetical protein
LEFVSLARVCVCVWGDVDDVMWCLLRWYSTAVQRFSRQHQEESKIGDLDSPSFRIWNIRTPNRISTVRVV